jgi:8-oxo-dGTP diphosphatase
MTSELSFHGAKIALFYNGLVLTYLRDNKCSIPFPNMWDLPGGGRENLESPAECVIREMKEEFGVTIIEQQISRKVLYPSLTNANVGAYFMIGTLRDEDVKAIRFGDEGQYWKFMTPEDFISHGSAIPYLQTRLKEYLRL